MRQGKRWESGGESNMLISEDLLEYVKAFGNMTEEKARQWIYDNVPKYQPDKA